MTNMYGNEYIFDNRSLQNPDGSWGVDLIKPGESGTKVGRLSVGPFKNGSQRVRVKNLEGEVVLEETRTSQLGVDDALRFVQTATILA